VGFRQRGCERTAKEKNEKNGILHTLLTMI
jgi:hypothetical protein